MYPGFIRIQEFCIQYLYEYATKEFTPRPYRSVNNTVF